MVYQSDGRYPYAEVVGRKEKKQNCASCTFRFGNFCNVMGANILMNIHAPNDCLKYERNINDHSNA